MAQESVITMSLTVTCSFNLRCHRTRG